MTMLDEKPPTGARVRYVPWHAEGDPSHPDCQDGTVSSQSVRDDYVFVRYGYGLSGDGQLTPIRQLVLR